MFVLKNFSFAFNKGGVPFFDNISLEITGSGLTCIVGKNGVGKSTLLRVLQGIVYSNESISGQLIVNGHTYDLSHQDDRQLLYQRSMILQQNFHSMLVPHFTGYQNLSFAKFEEYPPLSLAHISKTYEDQTHLFGISLNKPVHFLSGGQKQVLAMHMITQKELDLLLLDEPIAALDDINSDNVMHMIEEMIAKRALAVLCILHDRDVVEKYAKNVIKILKTDSGTRILQILI